MESLLKTYVNSCKLIPINQIVQLDSDLQKSYFRNAYFRIIQLHTTRTLGTYLLNFNKEVQYYFFKLLLDKANIQRFNELINEFDDGVDTKKNHFFKSDELYIKLLNSGDEHVPFRLISYFFLHNVIPSLNVLKVIFSNRKNVTTYLWFNARKNEDMADKKKLSKKKLRVPESVQLIAVKNDIDNFTSLLFYGIIPYESVQIFAIDKDFSNFFLLLWGVTINDKKFKFKISDNVQKFAIDKRKLAIVYLIREHKKMPDTHILIYALEKWGHELIEDMMYECNSYNISNKNHREIPLEVVKKAEYLFNLEHPNRPSPYKKYYPKNG